MNKIIYTLSVFLFALSLTAQVKAEELKTIIKPNAKIEAEMLLYGDADFTSLSTGLWKSGNYDRRSPIKIWNDSGLFKIDGQHINLLYGTKHWEEKNRPWASAYYLSLDGQITEVNKQEFKSQLVIRKYIVSGDGIELLPCRIEGEFIFKRQENSYEWNINDKDYPELSKCIDSKGKKQSAETILISLSIETAHKFSDYLFKNSN